MVSAGLFEILKKEISGEVLSDRFSRGRYATDASVYQMMPQGVVVPKDINDVQVCLQAARDEGVSVVARGGGTSQPLSKTTWFVVSGRCLYGIACDHWRYDSE